MKKVLKTELSLSYKNLIWRLLAPFIVLELIGISLDKTFHFHQFFKVGLAVFSIGVTIWGLYITASEIHNQNHQ